MDGKTLADQVLEPYKSVLTVRVAGHTYPVYYVIEHLLKIVDKNSRIIPFTLNYPQCQLYVAVCKQKMSHRLMRQMVLKARQIGYSTLIAAMFFTLTVFGRNIKTGIVADTEQHAKDLFEKYETFWNNLPEAYRPALEFSRAGQMMTTKEGHSTIKVVVAGDNAGRGSTYQYLHTSECAFYPEYEATMNSLLETVSDDNMDSIIFEETTGNGFNEFKDGWDYAVAHDGDPQSHYHAFFTPWYDNAAYDDKNYDPRIGLNLPQWLKERQEAHGLSDSQMSWYLGKFNSKFANKKLTLQEFPFTAVDSFISTGGSLFDNDVIAKRKEECLFQKPLRIGRFTYRTEWSADGGFAKVYDIEFKETPSGEWRVYEDPKAGTPYVALCDPNNGGSDSSAIQVFDNTTGEQVATFKTEDMGLDEVAYQLYCIGKRYNDALVSSEMNLGKSVMDYLLKTRYPKIYIDQAMAFDDYRGSISRRFGHQTTKGNRQMMIESFRIAFRENPRMIRDYETLCQMETFQRVEHTSKTGSKTYKDEAIHGEHDDLVMTCCAFYVVRVQQSAVKIGSHMSNLEREMSIQEAQDHLIKVRRDYESHTAQSDVYW
jgi:hypothetical protein